MTRNYVLRAAAIDDVNSVLGFWQTTAEDTNRQDDRASVERLLERDPEALILAVDGEDIVGSVLAGWNGWRCHLYRIGVRDDYRRQDVRGPSSMACRGQTLRPVSCGASRSGTYLTC